MRCSKCPHSSFGSRDPLSDICDGCTSDPDTGWGGFTDHSINRHFNSTSDYNNRYYDDDDDEYNE